MQGRTTSANAYDESLLHLGKRNLTGHRQSLESGAFAAGGILSTARLVIFERSGHAPFLEEPEKFASEVKTWMMVQETRK